VRVAVGEYLLDTERRQVRHGARTVHLRPKAYELLALLAARRPAALSKTEIQRELWPDTFVCEVNLFKLVFELRRALPIARPVRTVRGFGYAFGEEDHEAATPAAREA
jgi:DNA-binding winged helix-turn-helix (wHTH) protein